MQLLRRGTLSVHIICIVCMIQKILSSTVAPLTALSLLHPPFKAVPADCQVWVLEGQTTQAILLTEACYVAGPANIWTNIIPFSFGSIMFQLCDFG